MDEDKKAQHAWLKEREKPDDLNVVGVLYNGPKLLKKWYSQQENSLYFPPLRIVHNQADYEN